MSYPLPSWYTPSFSIEVSDDKDAAKAKHDATTHEQNIYRIYINSSGIERHVGASAFNPKIS